MHVSEIESNAGRERRNIAAGYVVVLAGALGLYVATCSPGLLWQDSGMFQYRIWQHDVEGRLGLALAHPLYILIGMAVKHVPVGEFAFRVNLISAVAGAFTVANTFLLLRLWLGKVVPALVGAMSLAVSWTIWQHSCMAEVYTLYTALFTAELVLLLQYFRGGRTGYLGGLGLLNGLAIANHMWGIIPLACYAVLLAGLVVKKRIGFRVVGVTAALWLIGASPYLYLIGKNIAVTGEVVGTMRSALFGHYWAEGVLNTQLTGRAIKENIMYILYSFPFPIILLGVWGLVRVGKFGPGRGFGWMVGVLLGLFFVFAFRYDVPDRYAFFIPFYCLVAVVIGAGAHTVLQIKRCRILAALMVALTLSYVPLYAIGPSLAKEKYTALGQRRQIPYRDSYEWFLLPWRTGYRNCEQFAAHALAGVADGAIIYADSTTVYALWFYQVINDYRLDVTIVADGLDNAEEYDAEAVAALFGRRPIYVVSPVAGYCPGFLLEGYGFESAGVLSKLVAKN